MPTSKQTTAVLAVALLAGSNAFLAPSALPAATRSSTTMSASGNNAKATAAAWLAGIVSAGAAFTSPAGAALFDVASPETVVQRDVGFGAPEPAADPTSNNAASGKTNGPKYTPKQVGEFAKENTGDGRGIDYGSAKGTDFGKTSGGLDGVATNTKATEGDFLADAKQNTREGVKIAEKNTKDAANVEWGRDVSKQTRGAGTIGDGIEKAKSIATGGATTDLKSASNKASQAADNAAKSITNPSRWGQKWQAASNTGKPNTAKPSGNTLNNGFTSSLKDAVSSVQDALPDANDVNVPSGVKDAGRQVKNKVQNGINTAKSATSDLRDPNVDASIQTPKVGGFFGTNSRQQAQQVAQKTSDKVKSDINTVQNAAPNSVADAGNAIKNAAPNSIGDAANAIKSAAPNSVAGAGNAIKSKVSGDVQTAKRAANDATPNGNELQNAANAAQSKVNSDVNGVKSALNNVVGGAVEQGSPASTLLSVEGGFFGTNPKQQADVVAQKTVDKVKDDIATARANPPFQGDTGNVDASGAAQAVKGKVNSDIKNTKKTWEYATSKVSNSNPAQAAKSWGNNNNNVAQAAKGKVNSDVNAVKSWGNNAGNNVDNAAQQAKSKVSSDVNAVKSWGSSAGDAVAKNTPSINTPEVGGFFGTNPKQQADTINAKTAQKVKSDINAVKNGIPSTGGDLKSAAASIKNQLTN